MVVTDTLPVGVTFVSTSAGCTYQAGSHRVICAIGSLNSGSSRTMTVVVNVDPAAGGTIINTATVAAGMSDPSGANNSVTASTTVIAQPDLAISKSARPSPVPAGQPLTYTLVITNNGPA